MALTLPSIQLQAFIFHMTKVVFCLSGCKKVHVASPLLSCTHIGAILCVEVYS